MSGIGRDLIAAFFVGGDAADIHDLARNSTFEEICYLLWFGALPTRAHLDDLRAKLAERRALPKLLVTLLRDLPPSAVPMDVLRTAVSALGLFDPNVNDMSREASLEKAITLTAMGERREPDGSRATTQVQNGTSHVRTP